MEKQQQELMIRLQLFDQQAQQLQQQYQAVEQATIEMGQLNFGLDDLKNSKDKEIMAAFGRGIFVKAKIIDEDLVVDVGGKNFVKKDIELTKKLIQEQIKKLNEILKLEPNKQKEELSATQKACQKKKVQVQTDVLGVS